MSRTYRASENKLSAEKIDEMNMRSRSFIENNVCFIGKSLNVNGIGGDIGQCCDYYIYVIRRSNIHKNCKNFMVIRYFI